MQTSVFFRRTAIGLVHDPLDGLFQLDAIHFHVSATGKAKDAAHTAHAQNAELTRSARVWLFQLYDHIGLQFEYLHG